MGREEPRIATMSDAEARELLARNSVGRLAYSWRDRVGIAPLHYAYEEDWIYARTAPGEKIALLKHNPWVAFEVDEVRGVFDWSSVVASGALSLLGEEGSPRDRHHLERARELLGHVVVGALTEQDPVPERSIVLAISIAELSGRIATTRTG